MIHNNEALVVKHWLGRDFWQLPGGGLHKNEDVVVGSLRELYEETHIAVQADKATYIGSRKVANNSIPMTLEYAVIYVEHKPAVTVQKLEIREFAWLDMDHPEVTRSRSLYDSLQQLKNSRS